MKARIVALFVIFLVISIAAAALSFGGQVTRAMVAGSSFLQEKRQTSNPANSSCFILPTYESFGNRLPRVYTNGRKNPVSGNNQPISKLQPRRSL